MAGYRLEDLWKILHLEERQKGEVISLTWVLGKQAVKMTPTDL
jgi:hypothetical protein